MEQAHRLLRPQQHVAVAARRLREHRRHRRAVLRALLGPQPKALRHVVGMGGSEDGRPDVVGREAGEGGRTWLCGWRRLVW